MDEPMSTLLGTLSKVPGEFPAYGILTLIIVLVARGVWVHRRQLEDARADRDARLSEMKQFYESREAEREQHKNEMIEEISAQRNAYQEAGEHKDKTIAILLAQNAELQELARTGVKILDAMPQPRPETPAQLEGNDV